MYTNILLQKTFDATQIGNPIIINLYLNVTIKYIMIRNATNSAPEVDLSTVFCLF